MNREEKPGTSIDAYIRVANKTSAATGGKAFVRSFVQLLGGMKSSRMNRGRKRREKKLGDSRGLLLPGRILKGINNDHFYFLFIFIIIFILFISIFYFFFHNTTRVLLPVL